MTVRTAGRGIVIVAMAVGGCGDNLHAPDAAFDIHHTPGLSAHVELGLLPPRANRDPMRHAFETSVAAWGDRVVATYINLSDTDEHTYPIDGESARQDKRIAVAVSEDRGETFGAPIDPVASIDGEMAYTSDPVVRAADDGTFWIATLEQTAGEVALARSSDGVAWTIVARPPANDKEWFALDDRSIWLSYAPRKGEPRGYDRFDFDGNQLASAPGGRQVVGMYVDAMGAHVAQLSMSQIDIVIWDGTSPPQQAGAPLRTGTAIYPYSVTAALGPVPGGGTWIVRTVQRADSPAIALRVRHLPDDEGEDMIVSDPGSVAFLPAATVDEDGRLRVVYYDSAGARGVLRTTRSRSTKWSEGFERSTVIDDDACPGDGWVPDGMMTTGGRRLREYIEIALTSRRVHVVWTRSPSSPSRVRAAYFDY